MNVAMEPMQDNESKVIETQEVDDLEDDGLMGAGEEDFEMDIFGGGGEMKELMSPEPEEEGPKDVNEQVEKIQVN
jgi:hypothetical protein